MIAAAVYQFVSTPVSLSPAFRLTTTAGLLPAEYIAEDLIHP